MSVDAVGGAEKAKKQESMVVWEDLKVFKAFSKTAFILQEVAQIRMGPGEERVGSGKQVFI